MRHEVERSRADGDGRRGSVRVRWRRRVRGALDGAIVDMLELRLGNCVGKMMNFWTYEDVGC